MPRSLNSRFLSCLLLAGAAVAGFTPLRVQAQDAEPAAEATAAAVYTPGSGDPWIDRQLDDINHYAARYPHAFSDEVSRYYSVPRGYVDALLQQPDWAAGDVFMACALAQRIAQPCRAVVREWSRDHTAGWAGVAERIAGSAATSRERLKGLRQDLEATYARWARPLAEPAGARR